MSKALAVSKLLRVVTRRGDLKDDTATVYLDLLVTLCLLLDGHSGIGEDNWTEQGRKDAEQKRNATRAPQNSRNPRSAEKRSTAADRMSSTPRCGLPDMLQCRCALLDYYVSEVRDCNIATALRFYSSAWSGLRKWPRRCLICLEQWPWTSASGSPRRIFHLSSLPDGRRAPAAPRQSSSRNMWCCTKILYLAPALQETRRQPLCCPAAQSVHLACREPGGHRHDEGESRTSASPPSTTVPRASRREEIPCDNVRGAGVSDSQQRQMPRHLVFARSRSLEGRGPPRAATIC